MFVLLGVLIITSGAQLRRRELAALCFIYSRLRGAMLLVSTDKMQILFLHIFSWMKINFQL